MSDSAVGDDRPAATRHLKPPNRKKHEEDIEKLNLILREKDDELRSLDVRSQEKVELEINKLHHEREQRFHRRQSADGDLRKISDDIRKLESELTKVQSNLQYRSEHKINEAIQRLEAQLKTRNFRLSEEKKIVSEIDALKRSTKDLSSYLLLKKQIDEKRDQQRKLRDERDRLQKTVTEIKTKEESIWQGNRIKWEKAEIIRNDIEDLQKKVKDAHGAFDAEEKEYRQQKDLLRRSKQAAVLSVRKDELRRATEDANRQEMEEFERCPFARKITMCNALIRHLQRFMNTNEESTEKTAVDTLSACHGSKLDLLNESLGGGRGKFLLRQKSETDEHVRVRKSKKRTPSLKKQIVHTPEIIDQFSQLEMTAPASAAEGANSIKQLKEKLSYYRSFSTDNVSLDKESLLPETMEQLSLFQCNRCKSSTASNANSCCESAVSGSIPTTPDAQFDASKLLQASEYRCQQSPDSGAVTDNGVSESFDDDDSFGFMPGLPSQGESVQHPDVPNALDAWLVDLELNKL